MRVHCEMLSRQDDLSRQYHIFLKTGLEEHLDNVHWSKGLPKPTQVAIRSFLILIIMLSNKFDSTRAFPVQLHNGQASPSCMQGGFSFITAEHLRLACMVQLHNALQLRFRPMECEPTDSSTLSGHASMRRIEQGIVMSPEHLRPIRRIRGSALKNRASISGL